MELSQAQYEELLAAKRKVDKSKATHKAYSLRRNAYVTLMVEKAVAKGIKVTPAEVDIYLKEKK